MGLEAAGAGNASAGGSPARVAAPIRDEAFYRELVEGINDGVVTRDAAGTITFASPRMCELLGCTPADIVGTRGERWVQPGLRPSWAARLATSDSRTPQTFEIELARTDGQPIVAFVSRRPVFDALGGFRGSIALVTDVTAQRREASRLQEAAQASAAFTGDEFFRSAVRSLATAFDLQAAFVAECADYPTTRVRILAEWDRGRHTEPREFALAGTPCDDTVRNGRVTCLSDNLLDRFPQYRERSRTSYFGVPLFDAAGGTVIGHLAFWGRGPIAEHETLAHPVFRIFASRIGAELVRKRAEDALRESEAKYRLLVENQTDLLVKLDRQGRYLFVSPSFCECFGRAEGGLLGQPFDLEINPLDRDAFEQSYAGVLAPPHRGYAEARVLTSTGWRWLAWSVSAILDERGAVAEIIACGRDVTERRRAEEQARQHLQQLAHVARLASMGEMATAIAHEVNQPLTAILSYSQACMRLLRSENAPIGDITEAMARVAEGAERASQIIRHLRSLVRKDEARLVPVQMNYLVGEVVRLVGPEARQSDVAIRTELAEGLPPVLADNIQIQQVLVNLARNAIEAINGATALERREVRVVTRPGPGNTVELCVADSGPGFDDQTAATLFEPFFTTKAQGMGIGLSISRSIVEAHQGRIWATGTPGRGASFHLTLPAVSGAHESDRR